MFLPFFLDGRNAFAQAPSVGPQTACSVSGQVLDARTGEPVPFAVITTAAQDLWTIADKEACFVFKRVMPGEQEFQVHFLGYRTRKLPVLVKGNVTGLKICLEPESLRLDEVVITADSRDNTTPASSSYKVDRTALDHLQATDLSDVMSLLPGGKFRGDFNLTQSATRLQVRGIEGEMNSASFATALEVDGVRMSSNADYGQLRGTDTRSLPVTNVESVEIVTGIPSVEYGDLNSGLVRVNTAKGRTPFILEFVTRPNTKLYALRKGFNIGNGTLNAAVERAQSVSSIISPYTTYDRNGLTLNYHLRLTDRNRSPLLLNAGFAGNIGGYDSQLDPDQVGDSYVREGENGFRLNAGLKYVPEKKWLGSLDWTASLSYTDRHTAENQLVSNSSSSVSLHTTSNGYQVAMDFNGHPDAEVLLLPPGIWYQLRHDSSRPLYFTTKLKAASRQRRGKRLSNHLMVGTEYAYSHNLGKGTYYEDYALAPTWREHLPSQDPPMHAFSLFLEDNLTFRTAEDSYFRCMAGIRTDLTRIRGSAYRTVQAVSPRFNLQYVFREGGHQALSDLRVHAGWGRAVKLPSFQILYPRTEYADLQTFTSASNASNIAFEAYQTFVHTPSYNKELEWQRSSQSEVGLEGRICGVGFKILCYWNTVSRTYLNQTRYRPFSYHYTGPSALEGLAIPSADRIYQVDRETGVVTVSDRTGQSPALELDQVTYQKFIADNRYVNGSPSRRWGIEFILQFPKIPLLHTQFRVDGNYYVYEGINEVLCQEVPELFSPTSSGKVSKYIAHYAGPASVSNGSRTRQMNLNAMMTTHIPRIRLIISLRLESTLMDRMQNLSESAGGQRSYALETGADYVSQDTGIYNRNRKVVSYPLFYSTWEEPDRLIPFREEFLRAREQDPVLYGELKKMVKKSNYPFFFDERTLSPYYSVSLNLTKELGDNASVSFYSTNFLNNMQTIRSNWDTMKESSIYDKGYIPRFYYGLSVRLKF